MGHLFFCEVIMSNVPNSLEAVRIEDFWDIVVEDLLMGEVVDG